MIGLFTKHKKKRCDVCDEKHPITKSFHELRLKVQGGETTLHICDECADFFDKSAGVINGARNDEPI